MNVRKTGTVLGAVVAGLVFLLVGIALASRPPRPNVAIVFLGHTNDSSGTPVSVIAVTNLSPFRVLVYRPTVEIASATKPGGYEYYFEGNTNQWRSFHSQLESGASGNCIIPSPTIDAQWKLSFLVYSDFGTMHVIKRFVTGRRYMPSRIEGDWIEVRK